MISRLEYAIVAALFATASVSAVIEPEPIKIDLPVIQLENTDANESNLLRASRFKFCRDINFVDCVTFGPIEKNQCCKYIVSSAFGKIALHQFSLSS